MAIRKFLVNRDDAHYEAWPDVVLTDGGKMICVFTECQHHGCRDYSRIVLVESADRGRTWSAKRPLTEVCMKDYYFNNARISKVGGRLAIVSDRIRKNEDEYSEIWMWFGDGEGKEFGEPEIHDFRGIVPDKLRVLSSGRLILAAHFKNKETDKLEQYLWFSDDGKNWSDRITVAADPRYNLCEACVLECRDGTLVAFMRENSFRGYDGFKAISKDGGEHWSGPFNFPVPGCHRPVAAFLPSGNILMSYRWFPARGKNCFSSSNTFMSLFDEDAAKEEKRYEQRFRTMPLDYDRSMTADTGYTGFVTFDDGEIYLVNYIVDDAPKGQIRGYSFREEDFYI